MLHPLRFRCDLALVLGSLAGLLFGTLVVACSGSDQTSTFVDPGPTSDASYNPEASFVVDSSFGDAVTTCTPALPTGFKPTWQPPAVTKGSCKPADYAGYAAACLGQPYDATKCSAWKASNTGCSACLESEGTAAKLGPVVWHLNRTYYTLNVAGCLSLEANDTTATGCAASYQAVLSCKEAACDTCFSISQPTFDKFAACEKTAGTADCGGYASIESTKCADVHAPDASTNACFATGTETAINLFQRIAPLFCGT